MNAQARKKLHALSVSDLLAQLSELRTEFAQKRLEAAASKLENTAQVKMLTKQIARIKTILTIKQKAQ